VSGSPLEALLLVLEVLRALEVRHAVVGSIASSLHGVPRATVDADLVVNLAPEQVERLVEALQEAFYVSASAAQEAVARGAMFNVVHLETGYKVDLYVAADNPYEQTKLARAVTLELADRGPLPVVTAEDLVLSKLRWYRQGKESSERQWRDVQGVVRMQPALDRDYLGRWAPFLGVEDLLEKALSGG